MGTLAITSAPVNGHHMAHKTPISHWVASKWFKVGFGRKLTLKYH